MTAARLVCVLAPLALVACGRGPAADAGTPPATPAPYAHFLAAADWPTYNRDLAGTRYSPLDQIDVRNVARLVEAWRYPLPPFPDASGYELTPLAVDGVLYLAAADRIVALAADTGTERWRHVVRGEPPSPRGVTYWPGDAETPPRLFYTAGRRLAALDAATGQPVRAFGSGGAVEMPIPYRSAPTAFEHLLIVGSDGPPGSVRAYSARTGAQVWLFSAVPRPGEAGSDAAASDAWGGRHGLLHRAASFTVDVDRALVYAVFGGSGPNAHDGGEPPGDAQLGNAVVALDARTGARRWHFHTLRHEVWDHDLPAAPTLLDVTIRDATVPVLVLPSRPGYLYILNRVTGEPLFGVEESPVPPGDVPGAATSRARPIPVKPPPLARTSFAPSDLVTAEDTTAEHAAFCRQLRERGGGQRDAAGPAPRATVVFPGSAGGAGWGGAAADPTRGFVFVNTADAGDLVWPETADGGGTAPTTAGFWWDGTGGDAGPRAGETWPCQKPPWGRLTAVSASSGEIVWQVPLGVTAELPPGKQGTGRLNRGGPIVTAGGLVFVAATDDRRLRAFASRTGEELWSAELPRPGHAVPITYQARNGKQYVAVTAGGPADAAAGAPAVIAYALP
ncbi:MAG TPA: PQQ-binding-like beta-propeller repeat protein [Gammaproteobacteria bacterium]